MVWLDLANQGRAVREFGLAARADSARIAKKPVTISAICLASRRVSKRSAIMIARIS